MWGLGEEKTTKNREQKKKKKTQNTLNHFEDADRLSGWGPCTEQREYRGGKKSQSARKC